MRFLVAGLLLISLLFLGCITSPPQATPSPAASTVAPVTIASFEGTEYRNTLEIVPGFEQLTPLVGTLAGQKVFADSRDASRNRLYTVHDAAVGPLGSFYVWLKKGVTDSGKPLSDCLPSSLTVTPVMPHTPLVLSQSNNLTFVFNFTQGTCANAPLTATANVSLHEGKKPLGTQSFQFPGPQAAVFPWTAFPDGVHTLTATVQSTLGNFEPTLEVDVQPIGSAANQSGRPTLPQAITRLNRYARSFRLESTTDLVTVELYGRRLTERPLNDYSVQLRPDANGVPSGSILVQSRNGLITVPRENGNVSVSWPHGTRLPAGTYWLVVASLGSSEALELQAYPAPSNASRSLRIVNALSKGTAEDWEPYDGDLYFKLSARP